MKFDRYPDGLWYYDPRGLAKRGNASPSSGRRDVTNIFPPFQRETFSPVTKTIPSSANQNANIFSPLTKTITSLANQNANLDRDSKLANQNAKSVNPPEYKNLKNSHDLATESDSENVDDVPDLTESVSDSDSDRENDDYTDDDRPSLATKNNDCDYDENDDCNDDHMPNLVTKNNDRDSDLILPWDNSDLTTLSADTRQRLENIIYQTDSHPASQQPSKTQASMPVTMEPAAPRVSAATTPTRGSTEDPTTQREDVPRPDSLGWGATEISEIQVHVDQKTVAQLFPISKPIGFHSRKKTKPVARGHHTMAGVIFNDTFPPAAKGPFILSYVDDITYIYYDEPVTTTSYTREKAPGRALDVPGIENKGSSLGQLLQLRGLKPVNDLRSSPSQQPQRPDIKPARSLLCVTITRDNAARRTTSGPNRQGENPTGDHDDLDTISALAPIPPLDINAL